MNFLEFWTNGEEVGDIPDKYRDKKGVGVAGMVGGTDSFSLCAVGRKKLPNGWCSKTVFFFGFWYPFQLESSFRKNSGEFDWTYC